MNNVEAIDRHLPRTAGVSRVPDDADAPQDLGAFGWLRGVRDRAVMLELRHKDGGIVAFPYAWLERADFDPSEGITLKFGAEKIKITGRNLNGEARPNVRLFDGIVRQRVPWVQEADQAAAMEAAEKATVIERIDLGA